MVGGSTATSSPSSFANGVSAASVAASGCDGSTWPCWAALRYCSAIVTVAPSFCCTSSSFFAVAAAAADWLGLSDGLGEADPDALGLALALWLGLALGLADGDALVEADGLAEPDAAALADGDGVLVFTGWSLVVDRTSRKLSCAGATSLRSSS